MRLTALSRKIDKTPTQLTAFLEKNGIFLDKGLHTKLDSETVALVMSHFFPKGYNPPEIEVIDRPVVDEIVEEKVPFKEIVKKIVVKEPVKEKVTPTSKKKKTKISKEIIEEKAPAIPVIQPESIPVHIKSAQPEPEPEKAEPKTGTVDDMESDSFKEIELIKAKKVKLDGFKVVGKIDLPEKPVKIVKDEENAETEKAVKPPRKDNQKFDRDRKKSRGNTGVRNPLSYEERLKREEREKARQLKKKQREEKLRRKKLYEETVKAKAPIKTVKKKHKKYEAKERAAAKPTVHKNPIVRFWNWLNGKYDRF